MPTGPNHKANSVQNNGNNWDHKPAKSMLGEDAKFDSKTIVDPDSGKILGGLLKVPPGMAATFDAVYNRLFPEVRERVEKNVSGLTALVAERYAHMDPAKAKMLGHNVADALGYASIFWEDIAYGANSSVKANGELIELRRAVAPILKANKETMGVGVLFGQSTSNEVIANAHQKVVQHYTHKIGTMVWDLPARLPQLRTKQIQMQRVQETRSQEAEQEALSTKPLEERIQYAIDRAKEVGKEQEKLQEFLKTRRKEFDKEMKKRRFEKSYGDIYRDKDGNQINWGDQKTLIETEWKKSLETVGNKDKTVKLSDKEKAAKKLEEDEKFWKEYGTWMGSLVSSVAANWVDQDAAKKFSRAIALDMILHLKEEIGANPDLKRQWIENPDSVMVQDLQNGPLNGKSVPVKQYIGEIFQQHQRDCKQSLIGDRYFEKEADMARITTEIGEALMREKMDTLALVDLVGCRKVVKRGGKTFARETQLKQLIEHESELLPTKHKVDMEEFKANATFTLDDLRAVFDKGKGVKGEERAFLALTFPKEVLVKYAGLTGEEVDALHKEMKGRFRCMMENAITELAFMAEQNPDQFKALRITGKEVAQLSEVAEGIASGDHKAFDKAMGMGDEAGIEQVVRNVALNSLKQDGSFVEKLTKSCRKNKAATEEQAQAADMAPNAQPAVEREVSGERLDELIGSEESQNFKRGDGRTVVPAAMLDKVGSRRSNNRGAETNELSV